MRTELVNFAISRYLPAIRQVSQPVFLPICPRMCALHSGTKGPAWRPLPPLNPAHTGGERAAEGLLLFVLPGRGPELQSASEVVPLLSVRVNMLSQVLKRSESRFISLESELKCEVSRINSDTDHEGRYFKKVFMKI